MAMLPKDLPDHHDAELVLRLYELRRDPTMRDARRAMLTEWWPTSREDVMAVTAWEHPLNAYYRQVASYWEMAFGMAKHGIIHPDYLAENAGEGFFLYAKVKPWLADLRAGGFPRSFLNAEWMAEATDGTRAVANGVQARVEKQRAAR